MKRTFPIFLAFLCMGFGDAVSTFVGKAKDTFQLSNFEAQLVSLAGLIMFGVLSVPMGILQDKISKKKKAHPKPISHPIKKMESTIKPSTR